MKTREEIDNERPAVTPHRAARLLGVHRETIYRWCERSVLREVRRGANGRLLISLDEIDRFNRDKFHF